MATDTPSRRACASRIAQAILEEWLSFHEWVGIDHFYLYDNESSDGWLSVVEPWMRKRMITAQRWPGPAVQEAVYNDCIQKASGESRWLAFLDDDEFLFPVVGQKLGPFLEEFGAYAGLGVSWVNFGSSGQEDRKSDGVIRRFRRSSGEADRHVKCVIRPERVTGCSIIGHAVNPVAPYIVVDENHRVLTGPMNDAPSVDRVRINHYLVKSWEEWRVRRSRPQANTGLPTPHSREQWEEWDRNWSRVVDETLVRLPGLNAPTGLK